MAREKIFVTREHIIPEAIKLLADHHNVDVWEERSAPPRDVLIRKAGECAGMHRPLSTSLSLSNRM